jgi:hypothetical protein
MYPNAAPAVARETVAQLEARVDREGWTPDRVDPAQVPYLRDSPSLLAGFTTSRMLHDRLQDAMDDARRLAYFWLIQFFEARLSQHLAGLSARLADAPGTAEDDLRYVSWTNSYARTCSRSAARVLEESPALIQRVGEQMADEIYRRVEVEAAELMSHCAL